MSVEKHVLEALQAFYSQRHIEKSIREQAHDYLNTFQKSEDAWTVCDSVRLLVFFAVQRIFIDGLQLLRRSDVDEAVLIFSAQTLHRKLQRDYPEVPHQERQALRQSLLAHLQRFLHGPSIVRSQICLAVAVLAIQLREWTSPCSDLVEILRGPGHSDEMSCLFEILQYLWEETEAKELKVTTKRLRQFEDGLTQAAPSIWSMLGDWCTQVCLRLSNTLNAIQALFLPSIKLLCFFFLFVFFLRYVYALFSRL